MNRASAAAAALILLTGAGASARPQMRLSANPSAVVAAEMAFNRLAQDKGQWTAFRETAAKDAVMFVPDMVNARTWLKGRKDPAASVKWSPAKIFVSCDGDIGASTGGWQRPDGSVGYFTTIWRRDKKGEWNWVLDHGDTLASPRPESDIIEAKVATCPQRRRGEGGPPPMGPPGERRGAREENGDVVVAAMLPGTGQSPDGTLQWVSEVHADKSRRVKVTMLVKDERQVVIDDNVAAPAS